MNNLISDFHLILSKEILILLFDVIELLLCKCKIIFQLLVFGGQVFDLGTQLLCKLKNSPYNSCFPWLQRL